MTAVVDLFGQPLDDDAPAPLELVERARRAIARTLPAPPIGSDRWLRAFRVTGPGIISFSGGRTSAYMLWCILLAYDGRLPPDVHVLFANTGREMPATLDFVQRCSSEWGVPVHWLEYRRDPEAGQVWTEEVNHNSASRAGEPFRAMLAGKRMLPNPVMRFCTTELKIRTMKRWAMQVAGFAHWTDFVGLRADEPKRLVRMALQNAKRQQRFRASSPLAAARQTTVQVMDFWRAQPFDLQLRGKWEGNCDNCFLKNLPAQLRMIADHPERAEAWAWDEEHLAHTGALDPSVALYRKDRPSYRRMIAYVRENPTFGTARVPDASCGMYYSCSGGCGA